MSGLLFTDLTIGNFDSFDWEQIAQNADQRICRVYSNLYFEKANEFNEAEDYQKRDVCFLLGMLTSFSLRLDAQDQPFTAQLILASNRRSDVIEDITDDQWDVLLELLPRINDAELKSRIADVLWVTRKGDYRAARTAIFAYMESANILFDPEHWTASGQRIERAVQLARQLGRNGDHYSQVRDYLENLLATLNGSDPLWFSHKLLTLLLTMGATDRAKYINLCARIIDIASINRDWRKARDYGQLYATWLDADGRKVEAKAARIKSAETYVSEAQDLLTSPSPNYISVVGQLESAIEALRRTGAAREQIENIHALLLENQAKTVQNMQTFSSSVSIEEGVKRTIEAVRGLSLEDAILKLAVDYYYNATPIEVLRQSAQDYLDEALYAMFADVSYVDGLGRVVARRPSTGFNSTDNDRQAALTSEMQLVARRYQGLKVGVIVYPAIEQMKLHHYIRIDTFRSLVIDNPFVPRGHEMIFATGLYYGLIGDFFLSAHILVPQVENSLRYLLNQRGVITSGYNDEGIQEDWDLGRLLYDVPELRAILGEEIVFDLQTLLVSRYGINLRNNAAHGKLPYNSFFSDTVIYFWWLILYLCCYPTLKSNSENNIDLNPIPDEAE